MSQYHEPPGELKDEDRDVVRALVSLKEEIEAVDWYHQRAAVTLDPKLKEVLIHNRDEEIEHACMCLEYLRRVDKAWDAKLRQYLFRSEPIVEIEEEENDGETDGGNRDLGIGGMST